MARSGADTLLPGLARLREGGGGPRRVAERADGVLPTLALLPHTSSIGPNFAPPQALGAAPRRERPRRGGDGPGSPRSEAKVGEPV